MFGRKGVGIPIELSENMPTEIAAVKPRAYGKVSDQGVQCLLHSAHCLRIWQEL
jgi:hypothetical protein